METKSCIQIFDQIMTLIGNNHRYQFIILVLFSVAAYTTTAVLIGTSFIFMNPIFSCAGQQQGVQFDESEACYRLDQCKLINDYTIVGYMELYCNKQHLRSMIQSSLPIGSILGLLIINTLSDIKGRKWSVRVCLSSQLIGMTGVFLNVLFGFPYLVALFQIVCGFGGYSLMMITYAIYYDVCTKQGVQNGIIILNLTWGIAQLCFYFFDNWIRFWQSYMLFFLILPTIILVLLTNLFYVDPPGFFLYKGHWDSALESCLKISTINKTATETSQKQLQVLVNQYRKIRQRKSYNKHGIDHLLRKLLCKWKYQKRILLLTCIYSCISFFYYGVQFSVNEIGLSYGINMMILGIMQSLAFIILKFSNNYICNYPRKKGIAIFFLAAGGIGLLSFMPFFQNNAILITICVSLCRFLQTVGGYFFILLQTESFSPDTKATGVGYTQGFGQIGSFLAPQLINVFINLKIYPLGVLSLVFGIVAVPSALLMDQTAKRTNEKGEVLLDQYQRMKSSQIQMN